MRPRSTSTIASALVSAEPLAGLGHSVTIAGVSRGRRAWRAAALIVPLPVRRVQAARPARPVAACGNPYAYASGCSTCVAPVPVNARQIELVSRATPKRQYYLQSTSGNRLFELGLGPIALALCGASDPATQPRIDAMLAEAGQADFAARFLADVGLDWAAEVLGSFDPRPKRSG